MDGTKRAPPRFVPTLTAVVDLDAPQPAAPQAPSPAAAAAPAAAALPARAEVPAPPAGGPAQVALSEVEAFRVEEELLHRVLQRVDLSLEDQLTEAVSAAVQQQLDALMPRLRQEIEDVLRRLVVEAMAQELLENPKSGAESAG